jgi:hypothetical protein
MVSKAERLPGRARAQPPSWAREKLQLPYPRRFLDDATLPLV